ncbi:MAG: HK97 gp10 family phage protein [Gammaproteobacteria bacterium]|nr:HK97 gp10 family phage protein [Gammaproteobacteria bacterium]
MTITVKLDTRELERIAKGLNTKTDKIVEALAFEVEADAKQRAPVRTGNLRNSIHTRTKHNSTLRAVTFMVDIPSPSGKIIAVVGSGVNYASYVEFGTYKMASRPYLGPAVESKAAKLNSGETWRELFT